MTVFTAVANAQFTTNLSSMAETYEDKKIVAVSISETQSRVAFNLVITNGDVEDVCGGVQDSPNLTGRKYIWHRLA